MSANRLRLPAPRVPLPSPQGFILCPLACLPTQTAEQASLYQWAFAQAQAVVRPSLPERDLLAVWN